MSEFVFAVVLRGHGRSPEEAWLSAVKTLAGKPGKCPDQWMHGKEFSEIDTDEPMAVAEG
jgi:hypothetical protein